jgi:hypothetical protein
MYSLYHPKYDKDDIAQKRVQLEKWYGEIVLIGRGCGYDNYDSFEFIGTMNDIIDHIKKVCNEEES